ncbi:Hypothetical_protein [Hexamita inflata]|uniref:Hypothetical_protein n=1 Tax=Hexamita inflata TaxID=28002 RepID=A0AA86UMJ0_9EUKA|nr:Hypothetical protein HINF_LOCUS44867 [Hexamita inflata]
MQAINNCEPSASQNHQLSCYSFTEYLQKQQDLDDQLLKQVSSNGQPLLVMCKRKLKVENLFTRQQFRQIVIDALRRYMEPMGETLADTLQHHSDVQLCEIVQSMGKYFWTLLAHNNQHSTKDLQRYYKTFNKSKM